MKHFLARTGFTMVEVLVAMLLLALGIAAIIQLYPRSLKSARDAEDRTRAALLAQRKAEEIRRDDDRRQSLIRSIARLTQPTVPAQFPEDPALSYCFSGRSILYAGETGPEADTEIPRVIVFRTLSETTYTPPPASRILYELRFGP